MKISTHEKKMLCEKYFDMVYRLCLMRVKDVHICEDITQDVFLKFLKTDREFESEEHIKAWLIKVAVNASKSFFTSSWFKKSEPLREDIVFTSYESQDLYSKVKLLSKKHRTVIHLFYYEDMSIKDIALVLKRKESTVKSDLFRARKELKKLLGGKENYEF